MTGAGPELRAAREARGETLAEAAHALRLDPRHLAAMEANDLGALPEGPFASGWLRDYRIHLGLPVGESAPPQVRRLDPDRVPLWAVRAIAGGTAIAALLLAGFYMLPRNTDPVPTTDPVLAEADQHIRVQALSNLSVRLVVDGAVVYDNILPGGEEVEVSGLTRVEVHLDEAQAARVRYNGELIEPQGRQDIPRRLVFIDDERSGE